MASSVLTGQSSLHTSLMEPRKIAELSLFKYEVTKQLRFFTNDGNIANKGSSTMGRGITVYKISQTGKRQLRHIAISDDNRFLLISSDKSGKGIIKVNGIHAKKIAISSIDRIERGQTTKKFLNK